jgi:hypothetical protein
MPMIAARNVSVAVGGDMIEIFKPAGWSSRIGFNQADFAAGLALAV